jgi:hypothetical protein
MCAQELFLAKKVNGKSVINKYWYLMLLLELADILERMKVISWPKN